MLHSTECLRRTDICYRLIHGVRIKAELDRLVLYGVHKLDKAAVCGESDHNGACESPHLEAPL